MEISGKSQNAALLFDREANQVHVSTGQRETSNSLTTYYKSVVDQLFCTVVTYEKLFCFVLGVSII